MQKGDRTVIVTCQFHRPRNWKDADQPGPQRNKYLVGKLLDKSFDPLPRKQFKNLLEPSRMIGPRELVDNGTLIFAGSPAIGTQLNSKERYRPYL